MEKRISLIRQLALCAVALTATACGRNSDDAELAKLDNQIVGNQSDAALTSALQDQILVDPTMSQQSNRNAVRPPETPTQAEYPGGPNAAALRTSVSQGGECADNFDYGMDWAQKLPAPFSVYPDGRVTEAAANNRGTCQVRVVTFVTAEAPQRLLDWYKERATSAGYSAGYQVRGGDRILAGSNDENHQAYFVIVTPGAQNSEVALITSNGA